MNKELVIRSALPSDRGAMQELTRDVWDGTDYVPFVWDAWLEDAAGWLMVATLGERIVGLQHIDLQPDGSAWVEGIRVAADRRDRGIGRAMLQRALVWSREHHCPWVRLATSSGNLASKRVAERNGLRLLGTYASVQAEPRSGPRDQAHVAAPVDFGRIRDFLEAHLEADTESWVYTEGWTAYTLTDARLRLLLAMGSVIVSGDPPNALAVATMSVLRPSLRLGLLCGSDVGMEKVCTWLRALSDEAGIAVVRANVEARGEAVAALASSGFETRHGNSMLLHGLRLDAASSGEGA